MRYTDWWTARLSAAQHVRADSVADPERHLQCRLLGGEELS